MKKIKLNTSRLKLTKEKIANLTNDEMKAVFGGDGSADYVCPSMPVNICQTNPPVSGYSPCAVSAFGTCTLPPTTYKLSQAVIDCPSAVLVGGVCPF